MCWLNYHLSLQCICLCVFFMHDKFFHQEELSALRSALGTKKEEVRRLQKQLITLDTATSAPGLTDEVLKAKVSDHASFDFQIYDKVTCIMYMLLYVRIDCVCTCTYMCL